MTAIRTRDGATLPAAGTWVLDPSHSHLEFQVRHMVVGKTKGEFETVSGTITIAEVPEESSVEVTFDPASINTKDAQRDAHLRSPDFLNVEAHPTAGFKSTSVKGAGSEWTVTGDLTIAGVTRSVDLALELEGVVEKDPWGGSRVAFSGTTEINREDFGLTWNVALEAGGVLVGKTVKVSFEVEAVLQATA